MYIPIDILHFLFTDDILMLFSLRGFIRQRQRTWKSKGKNWRMYALLLDVGNYFSWKVKTGYLNIMQHINVIFVSTVWQHIADLRKNKYLFPWPATSYVLGKNLLALFSYIAMLSACLLNCYNYMYRSVLLPSVGREASFGSGWWLLQKCIPVQSAENEWLWMGFLLVYFSRDWFKKKRIDYLCL